MTKNETPMTKEARNLNDEGRIQDGPPADAPSGLGLGDSSFFRHSCFGLRPFQGGRFDLHVHTTHSDGTYTADQVVDLACRGGLAGVAITDHDTLGGITEARAAAGPDLEIIAGVEITSEFAGRELHLLGYFFRPEDAALAAGLERLRAHRVGRGRYIDVRRPAKRPPTIRADGLSE